MPVVLEGGCRVTRMREGEPLRRGTLRVWNHMGRSVGARAISLRVLELAPGRSPGLGNRSCDEVLYVLEGQGEIFLGGRRHRVETDCGIYLAPGTRCVLENPGPGPMVLASSRCPEPEPPDEAAPPQAEPAAARAEPSPVPIVRLAHRESIPASAGRRYRILVDGEIGCDRVTQFVGFIPPGRAPDHHHPYEEVLCILRGEGTLRAGDSSTPIGPEACIFLPSMQVHCLENTGEGELRVMGVFYPAGSPGEAIERT